MSSVLSAYQENKLEQMSGVKVIDDNALAIALLKSTAFDVVNLQDYLLRLQERSGQSFQRLIRFISLSPFFNEGERHQRLKKHIAVAFSHSNLARWQPWFDEQIIALNQEYQRGDTVDLVSYSTEIAKRLFRPMILGITHGLPDDFENKLYHFQKIIEPLLPIRQLVALEEELGYLYTSLRDALSEQTHSIPNSFPALADPEFSRTLSEEERIILLIIVYGAKSPLMQTLGNVFLEILTDPQAKYHTGSTVNITRIRDDIDVLVAQSASLLHIHRVANSAFSYGDFSVQQGDYVLIRTRSTGSSACGHVKSLGFGLRAHYCSGAQLAKTTLSQIIPSFFHHFPHVSLLSFADDNALHTAKALTQLKVTL